MPKKVRESAVIWKLLWQGRVILVCWLKLKKKNKNKSEKSKTVPRCTDQNFIILPIHLSASLFREYTPGVFDNVVSIRKWQNCMRSNTLFSYKSEIRQESKCVKLYFFFVFFFFLKFDLLFWENYECASTHIKT